ncbi:MAG: GNAT family N-acetyltransferase [Lachnospiraceae bacterium]|nr:GNAT family N-acetyltransferase [Lachnospiraceae bacterium]
MEIKKLEIHHLEAIMKLAYENYLEECEVTKSLPDMECVADLSYFASNGLGVVAIENGQVVGFIACFEPWDNAFDSNVKGTFVPVHAHGAVVTNRGRIYKKMYEVLANDLVANKVMYHAIAFYAHDYVAKEAMWQYGFGMRCADAMKTLNGGEIVTIEGITYDELPGERASEIRELRKKLTYHLHQSPSFMRATDEYINFWIQKAEKRDSRLFVAKDKNEIVAFIEVCNYGETFLSGGEDARHICGAYCLENYRGGVARGLLSYIEQTLYDEGIRRLGVDFETFNPTAYGFWSKHFEIYTNSLTRRIDECGL